MVMDCWAPRMVMAKRSRPIRSWPNGCSPQASGQSDAVGTPSLTSGDTSWWSYFHQPGIPAQPTEVKANRKMKAKMNRPAMAPLWPRNRLRTICPWLSPFASSWLECRAAAAGGAVLGEEFFLLGWLAHALTLTRGSSAEYARSAIRLNTMAGHCHADEHAHDGVRVGVHDAVEEEEPHAPDREHLSP